MLMAYCIAASARFLLMAVGGIQDRVELATPVNSYRRLVEGVTLWEKGIDPYSGVLFHETPLTLALFSWFRRLFASAEETCWIGLIFVLTDLLTASLLGAVASTRIVSDPDSFVSKTCHEEAKELLVAQDRARSLSRKVQLAYLFNPYSVFSCAAKTTTTFSNLIVVASLLQACRKRRLTACILLAVVSTSSFYYTAILAPIICMLSQAQPDKEEEKEGPGPKKSIIVHEGLLCSAIFAASFCALNVVFSQAIMGGSWAFLGSTHGFTMSIPELTPNMGLYWYFFTEVFEHYRLLFLWTFGINSFSYVVPLTARFMHQPILLAWTMLALGTVLKSYPCYGDAGLYIALLPCFYHLFPYTKQAFLVAVMLLASMVFGPVLYQMWIYNGSANSNYFFAINMVYGMAQIFLITDLLFAQAKRDFYLTNGLEVFQQMLNPDSGKKLVMK